MFLEGLLNGLPHLREGTPSNRDQLCKPGDKIGDLLFRLVFPTELQILE
jgi:hypothetical protein